MRCCLHPLPTLPSPAAANFTASPPGGYAYVHGASCSSLARPLHRPPFHHAHPAPPLAMACWQALLAPPGHQAATGAHHPALLDQCGHCGCTLNASAKAKLASILRPAACTPRCCALRTPTPRHPPCTLANPPHPPLFGRSIKRVSVRRAGGIPERGDGGRAARVRPPAGGGAGGSGGALPVQLPGAGAPAGGAAGAHHAPSWCAPPSSPSLQLQASSCLPTSCNPHLRDAQRTLAQQRVQSTRCACTRRLLRSAFRPSTSGPPCLASA